MPTALVTGVAGFIGSHLAAELINRGYTVRGIDNLETGERQNLDSLHNHAAFSFHEGDIRNTDLIADLADGVNSLFHQAAMASVPESINNPSKTTKINCTGTAAVLDTARRADIDSVVVASSSAVYGSNVEIPIKESAPTNPESPYALSKWYTEQLACQYSDLYGINTVALRYFNVFGPRQDPNGEYAAVIPKFIQLLINDDTPIIYGDGEQSRDFVAIADAIQANILAAETDITGEVFNVGSGTCVTINELVSLLTDLFDVNIDPVYASPRPGDVRHSQADISKAKELLGYEPSVGLRQGLNKTIEYYKSNTADSSV